MKWLAVDPDGQEYEFTVKPTRHYNGIVSLWTTKGKGYKKELIPGTIEKMIGHKLTWSDLPIKYDK